MASVNSPDGYLTVSNLVKLFGDDRAVDDISFSVPEGRFLTLLGPSGCGKTTTLMSMQDCMRLTVARFELVI
jgi:iron(III) transport system ATP-binding protein